MSEAIASKEERFGGVQRQHRSRGQGSVAVS